MHRSCLLNEQFNGEYYECKSQLGFKGLLCDAA